MAFAAAAIPLVTTLLGAMSQDKEGNPQPAAPTPPTMGEMFAKHSQDYGQGGGFAVPQATPFQGGPVGGGQRGQ